MVSPHTGDHCCTPSYLAWSPTTQHWFSGSKAVGGGLCSQANDHPLYRGTRLFYACTICHYKDLSLVVWLVMTCTTDSVWHGLFCQISWLSITGSTDTLCGYHKSFTQDQYCVDYRGKSYTHKRSLYLNNCTVMGPWHGIVMLLLL